MDKTTSLYLMRDEPTGFYKIGRSDAPCRRETTLLAQAPNIYLMCYWLDCPYDLEAQLHSFYSDKRRRGEWFELNDEDVARIYIGAWLMKRIDVMPISEYVRRAMIVRTFTLAVYKAAQLKTPQRTIPLASL